MSTNIKRFTRESKFELERAKEHINAFLFEYMQYVEANSFKQDPVRECRFFNRASTIELSIDKLLEDLCENEKKG